MNKLTAIAITAFLILSSHIVAQLPARPGPVSGTITGPSLKSEADLGRKLFFDPLLSADGTVACASCHNPRFGWSDGRRVAVGINGQAGTRKSPTIINATYSPLQFWDGRVVGLATQALLPLVNPIEMGNASQEQVVQRLRLDGEYVQLFASIYDVDTISGSPITQDRLARAIAAFEDLEVVSQNAPIDKRLAGDRMALTPSAEIGFTLFKEANCMKCHVPPLFTDNIFHNTGTETAARLVGNSRNDSSEYDQGRFVVTRLNADRRKFKTPTLREIKYRAPYMHHGLYDNLDVVLSHYNRGGVDINGNLDRNIDPLIKPLNYTDTQLKYIKIFLLEAFSSSGNTAGLVKR